MFKSEVEQKRWGKVCWRSRNKIHVYMVRLAGISIGQYMKFSWQSPRGISRLSAIWHHTEKCGYPNKVKFSEVKTPDGVATLSHDEDASTSRDVLQTTRQRRGIHRLPGDKRFLIPHPQRCSKWPFWGATTWCITPGQRALVLPLPPTWEVFERLASLGSNDR